jgi:aspartate-semialdehyde dehydrogenase
MFILFLLSIYMLNFGIIGASGAVGKNIFKLLKNNYKNSNIFLFGSHRSTDSYVDNHKINLYNNTNKKLLECDFIFSAVDNSFSLKETPILLKKSKAIIIDNSSAYRYYEDIPLVIPEINADSIKENRLIANPNCTTAISILPLAVIHKKYTLKKVIMSSYQAASGSGQNAMNELIAQTTQYSNHKSLEYNEFKYPLLFNLIPEIDNYTDNDYTKEEMKVVWETRKILNLKTLRLSCTAVRVPILRSHSMAISVETEKPINIDNLKNALKTNDGIQLSKLPMPLDTSNKNDVYVGRIRKSIAFNNGVDLFVSGDQLLKGAALNSVQIADYIINLGRK